MSILQKIIPVLCCVLLLVGCYEDESEITLNADGSGTIKEKLVISERLLVATSESSGDDNMPPISKEKVLEKIGSAFEITSIAITDLPDGGRTIEFEGKFDSAERFFLSKFCSETLKLRLVSAGEGRAAIYCDAWQSGNSSGPSATQRYGMAKGLYIKRTIHLPAEIEKTNGDRGSDKNTVSWVMDLRNKDGLARTRAFVEGEDKGVGSVFFDASALKFSLPLRAVIEPEEPASTDEESPAELKAKVSWIATNKKILLDSDDAEPTISDLELAIELSWSDGDKSVSCHTPVLTSIQDDLGKDLVKSAHRSTFPIQGSGNSKELKIKTETPGINARKLKNIEGYVSVVRSVKTEEVILENVHELVGIDGAANPVLGKLNFRINKISGSTLEIEIDEGHRTITSIDIYGKDGSMLKSRGGMGWGNNYSYQFADEIPKPGKCRIEVVVSKDEVKVPFSFDEAALP
ncbi:MAG: hypothetical protein KAR47_00925 [Planctomycetes bacterium]|nr:hypothetical protein [Planctomycetota bacterium]